MSDLRQLCESAGLVGSDAVTAIDHYLRAGELTGRDLAHVRQASAEEREVFLYARYGCDGARVAEIVAAEAKPPVTTYAEGGYIAAPGPPVVTVRLDPDECVINRDRECIRSDHPTATSDGRKPGAWWRCEPRS